MFKILTCFKWVLDEADIKVDAGSRKLLLDRAAYKISAYDRNAVEEAMNLQQQHGASVAAVTVAPPTAKNCLKDVLSRGPEKAYFINDPSFADLCQGRFAACAIDEGVKMKFIKLLDQLRGIYRQ